jgi:hypothetical protein
MMPIPPDAPLTVRLGARLGPEIIASILVAVVVVVGISVALSGRRSPGESGGTGVVPSAGPSGAALSSESPLTASPFLPSTPARVLVEIVDRLLGQRAALEAEIAKRSTDAAAIADLLREVNASLVIQAGPLTSLAADPASTDLATRIRVLNQATFDAVHRTQRASISNEEAWRDGATEVVAALDPLPAIRAELAALAGEPPASLNAAPSQPAGTPAPSGATP